MSRHVSWILTFVLAILASAQSVQAWASWQQSHASPAIAAIAPGTVCSVMLTNGQIYYGVYDGSAGGNVRLQDVYYVQSFVDPGTHQQNNHLVSRQKADWHAPDWMLIPQDKVLLLEGVGKASRLVQLMEQDRKGGAAS